VLFAIYLYKIEAVVCHKKQSGSVSMPHHPSLNATGVDKFSDDVGADDGPTWGVVRCHNGHHFGIDGLGISETRDGIERDGGEERWRDGGDCLLTTGMGDMIILNSFKWSAARVINGTIDWTMVLVDFILSNLVAVPSFKVLQWDNR